MPALFDQFPLNFWWFARSVILRTIFSHELNASALNPIQFEGYNFKLNNPQIIYKVTLYNSSTTFSNFETFFVGYHRFFWPFNFRYRWNCSSGQYRISPKTRAISSFFIIRICYLSLAVMNILLLSLKCLSASPSCWSPLPSPLGWWGYRMFLNLLQIVWYCY